MFGDLAGFTITSPDPSQPIALYNSTDLNPTAAGNIRVEDCQIWGAGLVSIAPRVAYGVWHVWHVWDMGRGAMREVFGPH